MIFNRLELLNAIDGVSPSLSAKGTVAALRHAKLTVSGGIATVEAQNLRSRTSISFPSGDGEVVFLIPPKLRELLKKTTTAEVDISERNGKITIKAGGSKATMTTINVSEYPDTAGEAQSPWMEGDAIIPALLRAQVCASRRDEFPKYLSGVLMETKSGNLSCVSTDGRRMALVEADIPNATDGRALLPVAEFGALKALDATQPVRVTSGSALVTFAQERVTVAIRRLDSDFPAYRKILTDGYDQKLTVDTDAFRAAIDRASVISRDGTKVVSLAINDNQVRIEARSPDMGEALEIVDADTEGDISVAFNSAYLMDGLSIVESDRTTLHLHGSNGQMTVSDGDMRYILMPVRLGGGEE